MNKKNKNMTVKVSDFFGLPVNLLNNLPQIEMNGNVELVIDGINEIMEYDENSISIVTGALKVTIIGLNLQIRYITEKIAGVSGKINSVEFIEI